MRWEVSGEKNREIEKIVRFKGFSELSYYFSFGNNKLVNSN
jgi:hypothetical protein